MNKKVLYVAYGSNINFEQMKYRCPNSVAVGTAMLKGYELQFRYHATLEANKESEVPILLQELDSQDENYLDKYEGYPRYYRKEKLTIDFNGNFVEAKVYTMNGNIPLQSPSAKYYDIIEKGYRENGLDISYLETALEKAVQSENFEQEEEVEIEFEV